MFLEGGKYFWQNTKVGPLWNGICHTQLDPKLLTEPIEFAGHRGHNFLTPDLPLVVGVAHSGAVAQHFYVINFLVPLIVQFV